MKKGLTPSNIVFRVEINRIRIGSAHSIANAITESPILVFILP